MAAVTNQNTSESDGRPSGRPVMTPRQAALAAAKFHLLGGAVFLAIMIVLELPIVDFWFTRLGWWLGPWRAFPLPYDFEARPFRPAESLILVLSMVLGILLMLTSLILLTHGAVFRVTVLLHRWFGWPRYWPDVKDSISLRTAWAESARRSWWIWPVVLLIWAFWSSIAAGLRDAFYPLINDGLPFLIANVITLGLAYAYTSARVVRGHVVALLRPEDLHCVKCDYRLRGLPSRLCPECAHPFDPDQRPEFRLKWERFDGRGRCRRFVRVLLPIALLAAPLWVPLVILGVPRTWLQWIPSSLQPDHRVIDDNPIAFPIRLDAVCRIRRGEELCIVRFRKHTSFTASYVAGCWSSAASFGRLPPEQKTRGEIGMVAFWSPTIGPWKLSYLMHGENMIWLFRLDATYEVEAMLVEDFDGDLSWAEEDPAGNP